MRGLGGLANLGKLLEERGKDTEAPQLQPEFSLADRAEEEYEKEQVDEVLVP